MEKKKRGSLVPNHQIPYPSRLVILPSDPPLLPHQYSLRESSNITITISITISITITINTNINTNITTHWSTSLVATITAALVFPISREPVIMPCRHHLYPAVHLRLLFLSFSCRPLSSWQRCGTKQKIPMVCRGTKATVRPETGLTWWSCRLAA